MTVTRSNREHGSIIAAFRSGAQRWVAFSAKHSVSILCISLLFSIATGFVAARLRLDSNLNRLLPRDKPVVAELDKAVKKIGDLGYMSILIEHPELSESVRFAEMFSRRVASSEFVRTVRYKNPTEYLREHRFLLLSVDELTKIHRYVLNEKRRVGGLDLGLEDAPAADAEADPLVKKVAKWWDQLEQASIYKTDSTQHLLAINVRPRGSVINIGFVRKMHDYLLAEAEAVKREGRFASTMSIEITGSLLNKLQEHEMVMSDVTRSLAVSGSLIVLILWVFLRSTSGVILVLAPVVSGLIWTFALTAVQIGFLNTISTMLLVVLLGLGVDHGIHLLKRYNSLRTEGAEIIPALSVTMQSTGLAVLLSALTTAAGFFLMLFTDFRGFSHLGFIAGSAMVLITVAYAVMFPASVILAERAGIYRPTHSVMGQRFWGWVACQLDRVPKRVGIAAIVGILLVGSFAATRLHFNDDFSTLMGLIPKSEALKKKYSRANEEKMTPGAVIFAPDDATAQQIVDVLAERKRAKKDDSTIGEIISKFQLVPLDQDARMEQIRAIQKLVTPTVIAHVEHETTAKILSALDALEPKFVTDADLPPYILEYFTPQDGSDDRMVFVFPSIERKKGRLAIKFADEMSPITIDGRTYQPTGDALVFAEILRAVITQGLVLLALSIVAIALMTFGLYQRLRPTVHTMLALMVGLAGMAIALWVFRIDINFYNMVIFAAIVGMGVDDALHLTSTWLELKPGATSRVQRALTTLGGAMTATTLTTLAGYFGMAFSHHPGIRSIGLLALVGLTSTYLATILIYPPYLRAMENRST